MMYVRCTYHLMYNVHTSNVWPWNGLEYMEETANLMALCTSLSIFFDGTFALESKSQYEDIFSLQTNLKTFSGSSRIYRGQTENISIWTSIYLTESTVSIHQTEDTAFTHPDRESAFINQIVNACPQRLSVSMFAM